MSIQLTVYPIGYLVGYVVEGDVTDAEATAFLEAALAHPHFRRGFDFVGECRGAGRPEGAYPPALARALSAQAAEFGPCRWAVVTSAYGAETVRRWSKMVPAVGVEVAPFLSRDEAVEWLAAQPPITGNSRGRRTTTGWGGRAAGAE